MEQMTPIQLIAWRDQEWARTRDVIRRYGWEITYIYADSEGPAYAYTSGLTGFGHPELIVTGVGRETARFLLNTLGERVRMGQHLRAGELLDFDSWVHQVQLIEVDPFASEEYLLTANYLYRSPDGPPLPALQAVYDDHEGWLPWERGYHLSPEAQPVLGPLPNV